MLSIHNPIFNTEDKPMKTYTAVFAALLAASTSSLLAAPAMATEKCSTVAQCLGHETASAGSNRSSDDNGHGPYRTQPRAQ